MNIENLTPKEIREMDYNHMIGLVKETNRPPGGKESIYQIISRALLNKRSKVLEIGTSTGFTAIEIAKLTGSRIFAIDINEVSLEEARTRAHLSRVADKIKFIKQDVTNLRFRDKSFDLVFVGNVFSLVSDRGKAFSEVERVTKDTGFIAFIPMYYIKKPSKILLKEVSSAIHVDIKPLDKKYWMKALQYSRLEVYWIKDYKFIKQNNQEIDLFVNDILNRDHLKRLKKESFEELKKRYREFIHLFNRNLSHMGFSIILLRKKPKFEEDPELFTSKEL
jgi:ubiquinone/menaquinone biosynthesis C-methylase UbiE